MVNADFCMSLFRILKVISFVDGGSNIKGYVIEKRMKGEDVWTKASHALIPDLSFRVINLQDGREYQFRVAGKFDLSL